MYYDPFKQPTFLTRSSVVKIAGSNVTSLKNRPLRLIFQQKATVSGCAWYGSAHSLQAWAFGQLGDAARADAFFAEFYKGQITDEATFAQELKTKLQANISSTDDSEALNVLVAKCFTDFTGLPSGRNLNRTGAGNPLVFEKQGTVSNVALGALLAIPEGEGSTGSRGMIKTQGEPLFVRGLYLFGNVKISQMVQGRLRKIPIQ